MESNKGALPTRSEIDDKYKWDLEDIYKEESLWEEDLQKAKGMVKKLELYSGKLAEGVVYLKECLDLNAEISKLSERIFVYARMRRDEDNSKSQYQGLTDRASLFLTESASVSAFIDPEILEMDESKLNSFRMSEKSLDVYSHYFHNLLRTKIHTLSHKEEKIIAMTTEFSDAADDCFTMLNNADIKFPMVKDDEGNEVELTKGRYITFLESDDINVRREAFKAIYATYKSYKNTLASTLGSNVKCNSFYSKVRNYPSCIEAALDSDNVELSVYDNLILAINNNLPTLHKYLNIRKKLLGLDELHMYDVYVPFIDVPKKKIPYEDALKMVEDGLKPLGEQYLSDLRNGFASGWIDVYENQGKTSGAYSWGAYTTHPYVLLNYQGTINDVFTIAHEMGHALHSYNTDKTQAYVNSHYKIFVAEVASTVNELLLMNYMLSNTSDNNEKAFLLSRFIDEFRTTVFRQVMFAEFEKNIHSTYEKGDALTCDKFCEIYYALNKKYFGDTIVSDEEIAMEWARIPHFYSSFYVYKYATGFSSAVAISTAILNNEENAVENYMKFLQSGGSDYPIELLKTTGVDLSTPTPVEDAMTVFAKLINDLEAII
jgi:oligoendopeptidase F